MTLRRPLSPSSFEKAISALLTASETTAASHITLSDKLTTQVSETLKERERRKEIICGRVSILPDCAQCVGQSRDLPRNTDDSHASQYSTYYDEIQSQKESYNAERAKVNQVTPTHSLI